MTKATMAGEVGDVEKFREQHPGEGLKAVAELDAADPEVTLPGLGSKPAAEKGVSARTLEEAKSYVTANPIKSIAIGFGTGMLLSRFL